MHIADNWIRRPADLFVDTGQQWSGQTNRDYQKSVTGDQLLLPGEQTVGPRATSSQTQLQYSLETTPPPSTVGIQRSTVQGMCVCIVYTYLWYTSISVYVYLCLCIPVVY